MNFVVQPESLRYKDANIFVQKNLLFYTDLARSGSNNSRELYFLEATVTSESSQQVKSF